MRKIGRSPDSTSKAPTAQRRCTKTGAVLHTAADAVGCAKPTHPGTLFAEPVVVVMRPVNQGPQGTTGAQGNLAAPSQMETYLQDVEREEQADASALLQLIIKNAQEGRFGHSNFKDSDEMKAKNEVGKAGPSKRVSASPHASGVEAARTEIAQARDEVKLATSGQSASSKIVDPTEVGRTERLAEQIDQHTDLKKMLRNHI